jgi:hypothetical protein
MRESASSKRKTMGNKEGAILAPGLARVPPATSTCGENDGQRRGAKQTSGEEGVEGVQGTRDVTRKMKAGSVWSEEDEGDRN